MTINVAISILSNSHLVNSSNIIMVHSFNVPVSIFQSQQTIRCGKEKRRPQTIKSTEFGRNRAQPASSFVWCWEISNNNIYIV